MFQNKETTVMLVFQDLPIILLELNSSLMQTLSFVPINLHRCCNWPREGKCSIAGGRMWTRVKLGAIIKTDIQEMKHSLVTTFCTCFVSPDKRFISPPRSNVQGIVFLYLLRFHLPVIRKVGKDVLNN